MDLKDLMQAIKEFEYCTERWLKKKQVTKPACCNY